MDRYASSELGTSNSEMCSKCGMPSSKANNCCHDVVKVIKIQDDQLANGLDFQFAFVQTAEPKPEIPDVLFLNTSNPQYISSHSPPGQQPDTYLLHCVFRI